MSTGMGQFVYSDLAMVWFRTPKLGACKDGVFCVSDIMVPTGLDMPGTLVYLHVAFNFLTGYGRR